jgi:UDP:flavonoid glycosyltransferase YjiC (YdhE family)
MGYISLNTTVVIARQPINHLAQVSMIPPHFKHVSSKINHYIKDFGKERKDQEILAFLNANANVVYISQGTQSLYSRDQIRLIVEVAKAMP